MSKIAEEFGIKQALKDLGLTEENNGTSTGKDWFSNGEVIESYSPVDGALIGKVKATTKEDYEKVITTAEKGFKEWRTWPAPKRGEVVRQFNDELRRLKEPLGKLVSYEMGKSYQEGLGEVQEMIDICDFAVGLSRQLHGLTMHSERPGHRMYEQYHPLGVVGIISAFNFPVAVWSWNTALAWVCGDACIWKGSEKTPLTSVACQNIAARVFSENGLPEGISCLITGDYKVGEMMTRDPITVYPDTTIGEAAQLMLKNMIGCLPVLDRQRNLVGIITESDIFRMVAREWKFLQEQSGEPYPHYG